MMLHEAIEKVLKDSGRPMSAAEIADAVNKQGLYSREDKNPVPASQIHARVNNYHEWFNKTNKGLISLAATRINIFNDVVKKLFEILKGKLVNDISFLIPALIFYKRWLDCPDFLARYDINIVSGTSEAYVLESLEFFYDQLSQEFSKKGKSFYLKIQEIFVGYKNPHSDESSHAIEEALKTLQNVSFGRDTLSDQEFGHKFSSLFTNNYVNIKSSGEFSTPDTLSELLTNLEPVKDGQTLYNPAAGYFTFLLDIHRKLRGKIGLYGEEINPLTFSMGLLNMVANGCPVENIGLADSLSSSVIKDRSAALVICNPPLFQKADQTKYAGLFHYKSPDIILYFLQLALQKAKADGTVVIVVPESFLYKKSGSVKDFRKEIVECNLLDTVISLPAGTFTPYSMVKASILILKKNRPEGKTLFFDADMPDYCIKDKKGQTTLNVGSIISSLNDIRNSNIRNKNRGHKGQLPSSMLMEPESDYKANIKGYAFFDLKSIAGNNFDLEVKRYFVEDLTQLESDYKHGEAVELKAVLKSYKKSGKGEDFFRLPFINISNLKSDPQDYKLNDLNDIKPATRPSRIVETSVLLVGAIEGSLKPTIFEYTGVKAAVSNDVLAFIPDYNKIDETYLIYELSGKSVKRQIKAFSRGSVIKRIDYTDFLRIRIELPDLKRQKQIVSQFKEDFIEAGYSKENIKSDLVEEAQKHEQQILGSLKHEIAPLASALKGGLKTLESYIGATINDNRAPSFEDKISGSPNSRTLTELLNDMVKSTEELSQLSDSIQSIIKVGVTDLSQEVDISEFIRNEVENWRFKDQYNIVYHGENSSGPVFKTSIDKKQFSILIRNFLENTHKHGYTSMQDPYLLRTSGPNKDIVFNTFKDEETLVIELINNGEKLPEGFTFDDFISFGGRGGSNKGSGIGGYLMNMIVQNHGGKLIMMDPGKTLIIPSNYTLKGIKVLPMRQIVAGVYFRIILPLNNH